MSNCTFLIDYTIVQHNSSSLTLNPRHSNISIQVQLNDFLLIHVSTALPWWQRLLQSIPFLQHEHLVEQPPVQLHTLVVNAFQGAWSLAASLRVIRLSPHFFNLNVPAKASSSVAGKHNLSTSFLQWSWYNCWALPSVPINIYIIYVSCCMTSYVTVYPVTHPIDQVVQLVSSLLLSVWTDLYFLHLFNSCIFLFFITVDPH